jgi:hypothetical protein
MKNPSVLAEWSPEQLALGKKWVKTWQRAGVELDRLKRQQIRELDTFRSIELLCGPRDYTSAPYAPKPYSGLVEQQRWFKKAACCE